MTTSTTPALTTEQLAALQQFAAAHGRAWKADLRYDWSAGRSTGPLQEVRNTFGPSWLATFTLTAPAVSTVEIGEPLGLGRLQRAAWSLLAAGETFTDLNDAEAFLREAFRGWFIYRGGNHVALHRASGQTRLAVITTVGGR